MTYSTRVCPPIIARCGRAVDLRRTRAIRVYSIRASLPGVEPGVGIGWSRHRKSVRHNEIHLRKFAIPVKVGHSNAFALYGRAARRKDLSADCEGVVALERGVRATVVVAPLG